ncbi:MAG: neutral/alkaline non-lysosomal ceramidase N-terminal domain-containing protein [Pirellulales bacterium]|nr:neutral/alkaline non-lysosomal ceramidase N-terminal domain-containing protein [Pirellulales bacterium]
MMKALFAIACSLTLLACAAQGAEPLKAGAATANITPSLGNEIIGGFVPFPSQHIHDELQARCLVLDDGQTKIALVVCDLLGIHRIVSEEARKLIEAQSGIAPGNVMISATHTHSASSALGKRRWEYEQKADEYQLFVARRIADGVACAINNSRPAEIAFGSVDVPEHVFNRRWHMRLGTVPPNPFGETDIVKMNPPAGSPNLTEPAGPIDPTVSILSVRDKEGRPISVFTAYSLHYVGGVGRAHISADYYGMYCERLEELLTAKTKAEREALDLPAFVAIMANGTSGDINNIDFRNPRKGKQPYEQMRYVAHDVAEKVHGALGSLEYKEQVTLAASYREPTLNWRKPTEKRLQWAKDTLAAGRKNERDMAYIYAERVMHQANYPETTTVPLQVLRIGEVAIGTMPCEVFAEIGLEYRRRSPIKSAFMVELAHGYFGYLPTPRHHKLGGYETWLGTNRVQEDASVVLTDHLLEMLKELAKSG